MPEILSNPWVVGIGGGILSGLIVAFISRLIFAKRDNREYAQKLSQANHEVLYAVRPGISEGVIPSNDILKNLIKATARKYAVDISDMYDLNDLSSELMKEVMDSSFISASSKQDFCRGLTAISESQHAAGRVSLGREYDVYARYRRQLVAMISMMVAILTGMAGVSIVNKNATVLDPANLILMALPALVAILISFAAVIIRELRTMRLKSFNLRIAGLGAEFRAKPDNDIEELTAEYTNSTGPTK